MILTAFRACIVILLLITNFFPLVHGADTVAQKIHHFSIIGPNTAKVGEAIDISIEARDKDDKIIPEYKGMVFFLTPTDMSATLPSQGNAIQFSENDKGTKKFSKAVVFKKTGEQVLEVTDSVEDASGKKTIKIEIADTVTPTDNPITIVTPQNNDTLNANDLIVVSGYAKKNSKVNIKLNNTDVATVNTDDNGLYSKTLPAISQQSNILVSELLDGSNKVIGTAQARFTIVNTSPLFTNIVVTPGLSLEAGTGMTITVEAEKGLASVSALLDGSTLELKEIPEGGKYVGKTLAPAKAGAYPISVSLKSILSQSVSKSDAATITVTAKPIIAPSFQNVRAESIGSRIVFTFEVDHPPEELSKFKIAYGESADNLTEQVITKEKKDILVGTGTKYTWYIDKLPRKEFTFRIFGVKADGSLIDKLASEAIKATPGMIGCTIGNVGKIQVKTLSDKSILSWLSVTGAVSYNIYKFTAAGDPQFLQNTKETSYTLHLASGAVIHEDFGIKALCDEKTESPDMSKASKVQTGPGMIAFILIISAVLSIIFMRKRISHL